MPGFVVADDRTWVDPVVGVDLTYPLDERWSVLAKAMAGGFGAAAAAGWEAALGVRYRPGQRWSLLAGYRYLHEDYDRSGFALDAEVQGLLFGVGLQF